MRAALWNIEEDILESFMYHHNRDYLTIVAASDCAPPVGTIVICGHSSIAPTGRICALGKVQSKQRVATERVRSRIQPFCLLDGPIDTSELERLVYRRSDHHVCNALNEGVCSLTQRPKLFTVRSSAMIIDALRAISDDASGILDDLMRSEVDLEPNDQLRLQEEYDAVSTAVGFAGLSRVARSRLAPDGRLRPGSAFGLAAGRAYIDNEDDLIAEDLRRFDDSVDLCQLAGSMVRIVDGDVCLTVINVNRKELERVHGVDLVYYDHRTDSAVAVQYKRLERVSTESYGTERSKWVYRDKVQLLKQLDLMAPESFAGISDSDDLRLSSSPSFFKFVRAQDFDPNKRTLLKGMYVPDEFLRLGIEEGRFDVGPRGGFRVGYGNTRYFTSDTFIELVRRRWIGTRRTDRSRLAHEVARLAEDDEVVLAILDATRA